MDEKQQYFVVKAPRENLETSIQSGLWATQRNNEQKLVNAFHEGPVVLLFSAIKSNRFAGYALMVSLPNPTLWVQWKCPNHIELSDCFRVQWKAVANLGFGEKPYFDCQKLPPEVGRRLCQQLDEMAHRGGGDNERPGPRNGGVDPEAMSRLPRMQPTRFFVAKGSPEVLHQSLLHGVWATTARRSTDKLVEAFYQGRVILLLSSTHSNYLHGFCRMQTLPDDQWPFDWGIPQDYHMGPPFEVKWYCSCELMPHEFNPWNDGKPVTKCEDCTELPPELGNDLCQWMWEQGEPVPGHRPPPMRADYAPPYGGLGGFERGPSPPLPYERDFLLDGEGEWPRAVGRVDYLGYDEPLDYDYMDPHDPFFDPIPYSAQELGMHAAGVEALVNGGYGAPGQDQWPLHEPGTRYFIVRAPRSSFETSLESGLWATQKANEARMVVAYEQGPVVLLFCPVNSSKLQGFGTMHSLPSARHRADWQVPSHVALGDSFRVQWKCVATVGVGRVYFDGEELAPQIGYRYCQRLLMAERREEVYDAGPGGKGEKRKGGGRRRGRKGDGPGMGFEDDLGMGMGFPHHHPFGPDPEAAAPRPVISQPLSQATRFFVVRSAVENLTESLRRWVWVVSRRQQATLASAFRDGRVMLLFAPTGCDRYLGFMKMIGMPGSGAPVKWIWDAPEEQGEFFGVSWYCLCDVEPPKIFHPRTEVPEPPELQELPEEGGNELCQMMWESGHTAPKPELVSGADPGFGPAPPSTTARIVPVPGATRYFVVKAPKANIAISQAKGVWATHHRRQPGLMAAAADGQVVLLFSALSTQRFQGYATVLGPPDPSVPPANWDCSKRVAASLGECFPVRWGAVCNEPVEEGNPWNGQKPVWDCRDCQEVPPEVGQRICKALDAAAT